MEEHRTRDRKVTGSRPAGAAGEFSFPESHRVSSRYPFHPCVTAVALYKIKSDQEHEGVMNGTQLLPFLSCS